MGGRSAAKGVWECLASKSRAHYYHEATVDYYKAGG
jgi:hypothetical protein